MQMQMQMQIQIQVQVQMQVQMQVQNARCIQCSESPLAKSVRHDCGLDQYRLPAPDLSGVGSRASGPSRPDAC